MAVRRRPTAPTSRRRRSPGLDNRRGCGPAVVPRVAVRLLRAPHRLLRAAACSAATSSCSAASLLRRRQLRHHARVAVSPGRRHRPLASEKVGFNIFEVLVQHFQMIGSIFLKL